MLLRERLIKGGLDWKPFKGFAQIMRFITVITERDW
jgi:hypothetical protein